MYLDQTATTADQCRFVLAWCNLAINSAIDVGAEMRMEEARHIRGVACHSRFDMGGSRR
jgi:hypothetical protein